MGISYTVTPGGSIPDVTSSGGVVSGQTGGWIFPPNLPPPTTPQPPVPRPPQPTPPPNVTFSVQYLADGLSVKCSLVGATPRSVEWATNWAQNQGVVAYGTSVIIKYPRAGTFQIVMEAQYAAGLSIAYQSVTVTGAPVIPVASFTSTVDGLAVLFKNSSNFAAGSVSWDFGDGSVFSGQAVIHVYDEPGTYTVKMTADSLIAKNTVSVELLTGFGPIFWTALIHATQVSVYGVTNNIESDGTSGTNTGSAKTVQTITSAQAGAGIIGVVSFGTIGGMFVGTYTPYFGLANTDHLPDPSYFTYSVNQYTEGSTNYVFAVEGGIPVAQLDPAITAAAIAAGKTLYFSMTFNANGQLEYRYGNVIFNGLNFSGWDTSTVWYTSTVIPTFPLFGAATVSYATHAI